jgi:hypothetical protein
MRVLPALFFFAASAAAIGAPVDFSHQVVPILRSHCAECHTGNKKKGGLSMNDRAALLAGGEDGKAVVPGHPEEGMLLEALTTTDKDKQMPPKGTRVPAEEVALLKAWIAEGAAWEPGFTFKKASYEPPLRPRVVTLPPVVDRRTNPVDRIVDAYFAKNHLPGPAALSDEAFMRRASLDLVGLLPEPEALAKFLADSAPDKRDKLVESLLGNSVAYSDHWLTFWNDLLRNDYTGTGFITGGRKQITTWLYRSLMENKPYDRMARELIAPTPESAGFSEGIKWRGNVSAGQAIEIQFAQSVSQTFLGINMKCASCHDSFIDRWKLDEAYGLAAVVAEKPLQVFRCDKPEGRTQQAAWLFPELGQIDANKPVASRQKQLAALLTHPQNGRFTRTMVNRLWHRLMGRGIVHPVDAMQTEPWNADLLDYLAVDFAQHGYDLKHTLALICDSQIYQSQVQVVGKDSDAAGFVFRGPRSKRMTAEQFVDAVWQITSAAPTKVDAAVVRMHLDPTARGAEKSSAQWIWGNSAAGGKLPAAGEAIALRRSFTVLGEIRRAAAVITCDNEYTLYVNGRAMSAGVDWQRLDAVTLEPVLRKGKNDFLVVARNAGTKPNAAGLLVDVLIVTADGKEQRLASDADWEWSPTLPPDNSGKYKVEPKNWKPVTVVPAVPAWSKKIEGRVSPMLAQLTKGDLPMARDALVKSDLLTRTLGRPNRDQIVSMRPTDLGTLEAVSLANGPILEGILQTGAKKLAEHSWDSPEAFITWLYHFAFSRNPTPEELAAAKEGLGGTLTKEGIQDMLWAVCMQPEFQLVR